MSTCSALTTPINLTNRAQSRGNYEEIGPSEKQWDRGEAQCPFASHWDLFLRCSRGTVLYLFYYTDCLRKKENFIYFLLLFF